MECNVQAEDLYSIVHLAGEIDLHCSAGARSAILTELGKTKHVMVDLSQVRYIDSSAIASLVEGIQMAKQAQLNFALIAVSNEALQVLKLARLDKVFQIFNNAEDALSAQV